jgi:hypothetical protein
MNARRALPVRIPSPAGVTHIPLTKGYVAVVDECDDDLADLFWSALVKTNTVYGKRVINQKPFKGTYLHRMVLERVLGRPLEKGEVVDHLDGDGLNNRRSNLRAVTPQQNTRNKRVNRSSKSGLKGAAWNSYTGKWVATIRAENRRIFLGYYDTPEQAHQAYVDAAIRYFGEYAHDGARPLTLADAPIATKQLSLFADLERAS